MLHDFGDGEGFRGPLGQRLPRKGLGIRSTYNSLGPQWFLANDDSDPQT